MKKTRLLSLVVAILVLMFALSACGGGQAPANNPPANEPPAEATPGITQAPVSTPAPEDEQADWVTLEYKYATYLPDSNPMAQITIGSIQAELDRVMPGKIKITVYPSGTLLGQNDILDGLLTGTCDMGIIDFATVMNRFPVSQLFSLPGVISNPRGIVGSQVLTEWAQTTNTPEYKDVFFLWGAGNGPMCIFTKKEVNTLEDLKGLQLRASAVFGEAVKAYGATPVTMDTSEVYEAMRNGLLDGMYNVFPAAANMNLDELGQNALIVPLDTFSSPTLMSRQALEKMPPSQQEAFIAAVRTAFDNNVTAQEKNEKVGRIAECTANCNVKFLEGEELERFRAASAYILDDYVKKLDEQGLDGTGELKRIRELVDKYSERYSWQDYVDNFFGTEFIPR